MTNTTTKKATRKALQQVENAAVLEALKTLPVDDNGYFTSTPRWVGRLRHCNADVWALEDGALLLRSYSTVVAAILPDGTGIDFLRYVYGYTATSCKQIGKFFSDYSVYWTKVLTYRDI